MPVASTKVEATAMVNVRIKKKTPGWLVAARKGGATVQDPIRRALRHLVLEASCARVDGWGGGRRLGRLGVKAK